MYLTTSQITRIRQRPHRTKLWLAIFKPNSVFESQINQADITKGAREITVASLSGNPNLVISGMTCYISVSQGGKELGKIRVKSATATKIEVAENSISWTNGWFLTIVRYFEPWTVLPRIVLDDDNVPIFYKDYDIEYSDQNESLDPIVCMGPHHAGFMTLGGAAPTGTHLIWYTSSGSFEPTPGGTISSYAWYFEGGDPTGSTDAVPGWVTYTGCGHFTTELTITTALGKNFTGYRHIQILTRPDEASPGCLPHTRWGLDSLDGSRDGGGYNASIWVREEVDTETIVDGALIVIFSESWESGVETKIGANAENRDEIVFVGHILGETIFYDPVDSRIEFQATSPALAMSDASVVFTAILDDIEDPVTWNEFRSLTMDRALIHFLRWHSTLLAVTDFSQTGDTKPVASQVFVGRNIFELCNSMMENALIAQMVSDRQGKLWTEIDANVVPTGSSRQATDHMQEVFEITRQDWRNEITVNRRLSTEIAYLELGGLGYAGWQSGTIEDVEPLLSAAPGLVPEYQGTVERSSGLVLASQGQLNTLCGNTWAMMNSLYPNITVPLAGDYRFIDIAPQQRVLMTVLEGDTFRRLSMNQKPFVPQSMGFSYDAEGQYLLVDLDLREETWGHPGDTIEIPDDPPWDSPTLPPWHIEFPPIYPPIPWEPPIEPPPGTGDVVYVCSTNRIGRTRNFTDAFPNWTRIDNAMTSGTFYWFELDPYDPQNSAWLLSSYGLYRTFNLDEDPVTWICVYTASSFANLAIGNPAAATNMLNVVPHKQIVGSAVVTYVCDAGGPDNVRVAVTFDEGLSFTLLGNPTSTNQAHQVVTYLHEAAPGYSLMYLTTRYHPANFGFNRSMNGGLTWTEPAGVAWGFTSLCVPYQGNLAAMGMYACRIQGQDDTNNFMYRSMDMGANWVYSGPNYDGKSWSSRRHDVRLQFGADAFCYDRINSANLYFIGQPNEPEATNYLQESVLFKKPGGWYADWEFVHWFKAPTAGLHMHPTNPLLMYLLGSYHSESWRDSDAKIWGSDDAGVSWANKEGDWVDVMGTYGPPDSVGFNAQCIRPVWTI